MLLQCSRTCRAAFVQVLIYNCILSSAERHAAASRLKSETSPVVQRPSKLHSNPVAVIQTREHFLWAPKAANEEKHAPLSLKTVSTREDAHDVPGGGENQALGTVKPVSTTLWCIINITVQYMAVYTLLAMVHLYQDAAGTHCRRLEHTLRMAAHTVTYGPALCVLLLAVRMRVNWLTQGQGSAPLHVQICMYACTAAITVNTLLVLVFPLFSNEGLSVCDKTGDPHPEFGEIHWVANLALNIVRYLFLSVLYGGVAGIVGGMICYVPPKEMRPDPIPPVSPAVACTMNMSMQFFMVYFCVAVTRTMSEMRGHRIRWEEVMVDATNTVNMAPMLCVLFLSARMRALQMDPVHGHPQPWAQSCFYMCAYALFIQTVLAIMVPIVLMGRVVNDQYGAGDTHFEIRGSHHIIAKILVVARYAITLCLYVGFVAVIISIFTQGVRNTYHPVPPTLNCVVNLAMQFFFIYFMIWTLLTVKHLTGYQVPRLFQAMETARVTVMFAPILSILFIAMKMRALSLSDNQRSPPVWAQVAMFIATWAVFLQFCTCLLMAFCGNVVVTADSTPLSERSVKSHSHYSTESGAVIETWQIENKIGRYVVCTIRVLSMFLFYGGVTAVIVAILIMTPEMTVGYDEQFAPHAIPS